jgi:hypothetical protein
MLLLWPRPFRKSGGEIVIAAYFQKGLAKSQLIFRQKGGWSLAPGLISLLKRRKDDPRFSPDISPADFFLFLRVKSSLLASCLSQDSF